MSNTPDKRTRDILKEYFETGDRPKEIEFSRLIDSGINQKDDELFAVNGKIGVGTNDPQSKLHVSGQAFISKLGGANAPRTGNMLEVNADNQGAVAIVTKSNDVLNFVDDGVALNPNPFTITDNSGRGFRFYKNSGDLATDGEKLRIQPNGNVGIGTSDPKSKLHISGQTFVSNPGGANVPRTGNMLEVNADNQSALAIVTKSNDVLNFVDDGATINPNPFTITDNSGRGFRFYKNAGDLATDGEKLRIQPNGHVGIGTINPQNKLEINGTVDTGLRLPTGKGYGKILTSDSNGNAIWKPATDITNSLWQAIGTTGHIRNGNTGNVGVGNSNPQATLDISGTSENENNHGILKINAGTVGKDLRFGVVDGTGGYTWIQSHGAIPLKINPHPAGNTTTINEGGGKVGIGISSPQAELHLKGTLKIESSSNDVVIFNDPNYPNGSGLNTNPFTILDQTGSRGFRFWSNANSDHANVEAIRIEPTGNLRMNNHSIFLRAGSDQNHGIGFVSDDVFDNRPNKMTGEIPTTVVDGPFVFGYQGGALGTDQYGSKNVALQWFRNKSVDFKGNITVYGDANFRSEIKMNNKFPFLIKRFTPYQKDMSVNQQSNLTNALDTKVSTTEFEGAIITGHYAYSGKTNAYLIIKQYISVFKYGGTWRVSADIDSEVPNSAFKHEKWYVDVMFIRKGIVELDSASDWSRPLNLL